MVDYSRWDKWAEDVESSDDERANKPTVTKFDTSQSVTFGGGTRKILHRESTTPTAISTTSLPQHLAKTAKAPQASAAAKVQVAAKKVESTTSNARTSTVDTVSASAATTRPKAAIGKHTRNGGLTSRYHWAQSMDTVTCYIFVPAGTRGRQVRIAMDERHIRVAVVTDKGDEQVLVDGMLCGSIRPPREKDDIDWEMKDLEVDTSKDFKATSSTISPGLARTMCVTMHKEPMGMGVIHWWKTVIKGDPEIDVAAIPDRRGASLSKSAKDRSRALQDSWRIAHEQFKAKCKTRKKVAIDY